MGRSSAAGIAQTADANSAADQTTATTAQADEQQDIGNYEAQLSKYAADNPYTAGGEYQTSQNQTLAGTADAGSAALTDTLQTQAKRTGQNATAANATAAEAARQNQIGLSSAESADNTQRIGDEANYNAGVLQDTGNTANMEAQVANPALSAAGGQLNTAVGANKQDSTFWDDFGSSAASTLGKVAAVGAAGAVCWIAAELYGGWLDQRTIDVRAWLFGPFRDRWYGRVITNLYYWCGEWLAGKVRKYHLLRRLFLPIFNVALKKARGC